MGIVLPSELPPIDQIGRRNFFVGAVYAMWAAIGAALGLPALGYLLLPPKLKQQQDWTQIGDLSRLVPGIPVEMVFRRNRVDGWKINSEKSTAWVVKESNKSVIAFGPQCTHLGCAYHWDAGQHQFLCPCHNSIFSADGKVISGPAPRPLDRYATRVDGTHIFIGSLQDSSDQPA